MLSMISLVVAGLSLCAAPQAPASSSSDARVGDIYVVNVTVGDHAGLQPLVDAGYDIDNYQDGVARVYATAEELDQLDAWGYAYEWVETQPAPYLDDTKGLRDIDAYEKAASVYISYQALTTALQTYTAQNADIARLVSLGKTVENRDIWAIKISDNPDAEEDEPEVKYIGTMHGDEPIGTYLLMKLIPRLLYDYGADSRITNLVNNSVIWIVPLMNPDGYVRQIRYNAQNKDLNRTFPDWPEEYLNNIYTGGTLDVSGRPPEVAHVMRWIAANSFVLSANFHSGALLVNYPYDDGGLPEGDPAPTPDELLFRNISLRYSTHNLPMYNNPNDPDSPEAPDGITNGAAWYIAEGGMQDWNYRYACVNEVTVELSETKQPSSSAIPQLWADNQESMLTYLEAAQIGIRGVVTNSQTGKPVYAQINVSGNSHPVFTDPGVGDYHRMLLPGTYTISVSAPGFTSKAVGNIVVGSGAATRVDVVLVPLLLDSDIDNNDVVNAVDVQLVVNRVLGLSIGGLDADVDNNGIVNAIDLQIVVNRVLGIL